MIRQSSNEESALSAYIGMLLDLHELIRTGRGDSAEADELRDRMDAPWRRLEASEIALVDGLSADLHTLGVKRDAPDRDASDGDESKRFEQAFQQEDWASALEAIRTNEPRLAPRTVSFCRGVCWAHLGEPEVAISFLNDAASFEPLAPDEEFWLLMCAVQAGHWTEVVGRAREIARATTHPLLLLEASIVLFRAAMEEAQVDAEAAFHEASQLANRALAAAEAVSGDELLEEMRASVLVHMALSYDQFGDRQAAMNACQRALEIDPGREAARELLELLNDGTGAAGEMDAFRRRFQQRLLTDTPCVPALAELN